MTKVIKKPKNQSKLCPMTFENPQEACKCVREKCAWWDAYASGCVIKTLSWIKAIATTLKEEK